MPDSLEMWGWWFFSAVITGIGINLLSAPIQRFLDKHFALRRSLRLQRNKENTQFVEELVRLMEADPKMLSVVLYRSRDYKANSIYGRLLAFIFFVIYAVLPSSGSNISSFVSTVIFLFIIFGAMAFGNKELGDYQLYAAAISKYEDQHHIPRPPK